MHFGIQKNSETPELGCSVRCASLGDMATSYS
jgi:hypothetical protein